MDLIRSLVKLANSIRNTKTYIKQSKGLCGLINLGNTSHVNAMVQLLAHIPSIRYFYKSLHQKAEKSTNLPPGSTKKFSYLLADLLSEIWSGEWRVFKPSVITKMHFIQSYRKL